MASAHTLHTFCARCPPARAAHELFYGAYKGQRMAENLARVDALQFEMLDFDREDARQAGELRP